MSGYALHPAAVRDIADIWDYIASDSPRAADREQDRIFVVIRRLARNPYLGRQRLELTSLPVRFGLARNYLIVYDPDSRPMLVLAVVDARRSPRILSALLRLRR